MRPASGTTLQNPVLSQYFTEYVASAETRLAGLQALPTQPVPYKAGDITIKRREEDLAAQQDTERAPGGTYNRAEWAFERMGYETVEHGIEFPLDDSEVLRYSDFLNIPEANTQTAIDQLLLAQELRIKDELFSTTTFSGYTGAITHEWDDATNAVPKSDIDTVAATVAGNCGKWPTDLLLPYTVFLNVMKTDEIKNYSQYTSTLLASPIETQRQWLSAYLGVNVILAGAYYNSALEGASASLSAVWGTEYALLFVKSENIARPGIGWTLRWAADSPDNVNVEEYREEQTRGSVLRVRHHVQENVFAAEFGYLISNMTT